MAARSTVSKTDLDTRVSEKRLENYDEIRAYVLGGKAEIRLHNVQTGQSVLFKLVQGKKPCRNGAPAPLFAHTTGNRYVGALFVGGRWSPGNKPTRPYAGGGLPLPQIKVSVGWFLGRLVQGLPLPETLEVWHQGRCGRCGRPLTDPVSVDCGIGPVCRTKAHKLHTKRELLDKAGDVGSQDWRPGESLPEDYYAL